MAECDFGISEMKSDAVPMDTTDDKPAKPAATKKRARKPAATGAKSDASVVVLHDRFVCSYTGEIRGAALFVPGYPGVCFANLPCAFAWINDNVPEEAARAELKQKTCDEYQQPSPDGVALPSSRELLAVFGGQQTYAEWIGDLRLWDGMTEKNGITVSDWQAQRGNKGGATGKSRNKLVLEAGSYSIGVGGPSQTKRVTVLGGETTTTAEGKKRATPGLTDVKAMQAQDRFMKAHPEYTRLLHVGDHFVAVCLVPDALAAEPVKPDPNFHNAYATACTGLMCYGPTFVISYKKKSVKL